MNLALSDEQVMLREAAREALSRVKTLEAAREALEGKHSLPDLWPTACEAGWPGLLIDERHGGAGLDAFDAMLVMEECGRVLAGISLLGHLPASAILNAAPAGEQFLAGCASGEMRAAYLPARPPDAVADSWHGEGRSGIERAALPALGAQSADGRAPLSGSCAFVPDAPGAALLVGAGERDGEIVAFAIPAEQAGVQIEPVMRYDATRSLGHVSFSDARALVLDCPLEALVSTWHLAQALLAAESIGAVASALEVTVGYAKDRFTFGRAIGSYQAVKHQLTEVLRRLENGRSLLYYAGFAYRGAPAEFALAASAARSVAGGALDYAARAMISIHGGIGATWEHDAPLYFRRAQLSRLLLGGTDQATERVADETFARLAA
jgi:alkylation response protein AidB-like acyl-CoA dehydrogenase